MPCLDQPRGVGDSQPPPVFTLDKILHSNVIVIENAVIEITAGLSRLGWGDDIDLIALAIREALMNALVHGSRHDPKKTIGICLALNVNGSLFVAVRDSGAGFDPNAIPDGISAGNLSSGQGIFLMRRIMDEVVFSFDHGTEVRMSRNPRWLE